MTDPYKKVGVAKRFLLRRLGAGPGEAIFSCEHLLGDSVEVVDARDFDAVVDDAARYRFLRDSLEIRGERLDQRVDQAMQEKTR
jgi:hypothetical protein